MKYSNHLKTSAHTPHQSIDHFQSQVYFKNVQRLQIILRALLISKCQSYQLEFFGRLQSISKNKIQNNKQILKQLSQQEMIEQFLNHCATKIQAKFKAYRQRKYYLKFLPIYRRLRQILLAAALGWKTRKIINLQQNQKVIHQIKKLESNQQYVKARIEKRQFINTFFKLFKSGKWVELAKKELLHNKKYQKIRIKNILIPEKLNQSILRQHTKKPLKNSQDKLQLNQTKKIIRTNDTLRESKVIKITEREYKHQFDDIPIKGNSKGVYNFQQTNEPQRIEQKPVKHKKNTKKPLNDNKQVLKNNPKKSPLQKQLKQSIIAEKIIYKTGQMENPKDKKPTKRQKLTLVSHKKQSIQQKRQEKRNEQFVFCSFGQIDEQQVIILEKQDVNDRKSAQDKLSNSLLQMYETRYKDKKQVLNEKMKQLTQQKTPMLSTLKLKILQ